MNKKYFLFSVARKPGSLLVGEPRRPSTSSGWPECATVSVEALAKTEGRVGYGVISRETAVFKLLSASFLVLALINITSVYSMEEDESAAAAGPPVQMRRRADALNRRGQRLMVWGKKERDIARADEDAIRLANDCLKIDQEHAKQQLQRNQFEFNKQVHEQWQAKQTAMLTAATGLAVGFKKHCINMNSEWFTLFATAFFELLHKKKVLQEIELPFPDAFNKKVITAFRGGLYANIIHSFLGNRKMLKDLGSFGFGKSLNGWQLIGSYILVDLASDYGWDEISPFFQKNKKTKKRTRRVEVKRNPTQKSSQFEEVVPVFAWVVKTYAAGVMVRLLRELS